MKRFYSKFRIALMTLAIGLASVWYFKGMNEGFFDVHVELPKVKSENVLIILPRTEKEMPYAGGSACGGYVSKSKHLSSTKQVINP